MNRFASQLRATAIRLWPVLSLWVLLAVIVLAANMGSSAIQATVVTMLIQVIIVVGLYMFVGNSGILSFGHMSFVAVGAYVAGLLTIPVETKHLLLPHLPGFVSSAHLPEVAAALLAGVVAAFFALIVSVPVMRLNGIAASLATFALLVIVYVITSNWTNLTGGSGALIGVPMDISMGSVLVWTLAVIGIAYAFQQSRFGLRLRASREDESASRAVGVNVAKERRIAFVISAFVTALGGSLYAHLLGSFSSDAFYLDLTFVTLAMLVFGGIGSLAGAVVGTVTISWLLEGLRIVEQGTTIGPFHIPARAGLQEVGLALALLLILLIRPRGLLGGREITWPPGGPRSLFRRRSIESPAGSALVLDSVMLPTPEGEEEQRDPVVVKSDEQAGNPAHSRDGTLDLSPKRRQRHMTPKVGQFTEAWILEEAQRQYTTGQATIGIDAGRTALIVVDMIDEFVKPHWSPYWCPEATRQVPKIQKAINAFHDAGLPVIYLAYEISVHGLNFPAPLFDTPMAKGLEESADEILQSVSIYEGIAPEERDIVILKHTYSGFRGTELDLVLRRQDISTIVVCGTMTNYCCGATARDAMWHGYRVIFGSDINSNDDPELHEAELKTLRRGYARIMTSDQIIDAVRESTHQSHAS